MLIPTKFEGYSEGGRLSTVRRVLFGDPVTATEAASVLAEAGTAEAASATAAELAAQEAARQAAIEAARQATMEEAARQAATQAAAPSGLASLPQAGPYDIGMQQAANQAYIGLNGPSAVAGLGDVVADAGTTSAMQGGFGPGTPATPSGMLDGLGAWAKENPKSAMLLGFQGLNMLDKRLNRPNIPGTEPYNGPLSRFKYDPSTYKPYTYKPYADGGLATGGITNLGGYSDGGRLLRGPGDGVSDSIPAVIGDKQPARLADGEFVVPARIVSELGNGSTEAGARKLYAMMDRVQKSRAKTTGKNAVAKNTNAAKHLPV